MLWDNIRKDNGNTNENTNILLVFLFNAASVLSDFLDEKFQKSSKAIKEKKTHQLNCEQ